MISGTRIVTLCWLLLISLSTVVLTVTYGQLNTQEKIRAHRRANEHRILRDFVDFLSIPNVASDSENIRKNAEFIGKMMQSRSLMPRLLEAKVAGAPPAVYGERIVPGASRTIVFYAHYDGQPTDPKQWTGSLPWTPVLRTAALEAGGKIIPLPSPTEPIDPEWRLYARSASDDKGGVMAILSAVAVLQASGVTPTSNLKFFFEGEEEAGSAHISEIITKHQQLLQADAWLICDGPVHQSGRKQVVFGVRGDTNVDLTVYGAKRPLHSGHYGNWAPNPAQLLARLLSSMKDQSGRVTIAGWYDDVEPLGQAEQQALAQAPRYDNELKSELGLAQTENAGQSLLELLHQPSLNINGISSGDVGALARNVIPTMATAVLDLRLVKGNDYQRQVARLVEHIRKQGFYVIDREPNDLERSKYPLIAKVVHRPGGYNAERTRMDLPISIAVLQAVASTTDQPIVRLASSGGSLPLSLITANLQTVTITVPIANYDNNQHAENENIRLQNLWDGIEIMAALMTMAR
jgi:acetylornithine deacetylase/succinyl-diaminopimelate desuccinylase-like protein